MLVLPFFISLIGQKGIRKMNSKTKQFFQFVFSRGFLKQIGLMLVVLFILIFLTFMFIRFYTNHGEAVEVPALKGLTMEEAGLLLSHHNLQYVIIDSVYDAKAVRGSIIEQVPAAGEFVKSGRSIYITINTVNKPLIVLPDVKDLSLRNARALLESQGLKVIGIEQQPGEQNDLALYAKTVSGHQLVAGERIAIESSVILVVSHNSDLSLVPDTFSNTSANDIISEGLQEENGEIPSSSSKRTRKSGDIEDFF